MKKQYGEIGTFISDENLSGIVKKVSIATDLYVDSIVSSQGMFHFSNMFFEEHSEASNYIGAGTGSKIVSNVIENLPNVFLDEPQNESDYIKFLGRIKNQRVYKYILRDYLAENEYIDVFKVFSPKANGNGQYGETLTMPEIGYPLEGCADTFLCIGRFNCQDEAENFIQYMKTKLFRALLGVNKVTQDCPKFVWRAIPLQDFTDHSDIDWSKSVHEIDLQLYRKYGLDEKEIDFIETHVKEMA